MGVVYEAQDARLPRSVAIKFLKPALSHNADAVKRFKREARLASSLNHPNICTILDIDEFKGQSFIAMELLDGRSLKDTLAAGPMKLPDIIDVGMQIASALGTAHDRGIMHRDITPGNIFVTSSGLVKLLDFGLAKHFAVTDDDSQVTDDLTHPGAVAGTAHYMAPELFGKDAVADHRCDLYSLGAVLYQMTTGARPFEARSRQELIALIHDQPPIPLRRLAPQHPARLEQIVDQLLTKDPDGRYQSGWQLRSDLDLLRQQVAAGTYAARTERRLPGIAVLPFRVIESASSFLDEFAEGLAEDLSGRLSHVPELRVAPRTMTVPVARLPATEIGSRLDVQLVLGGTVQQVGDRVRVAASLVDAKDGHGTGTMMVAEGQMNDLFVVQDDIARQIADSVAGGFMRGLERPATRDPEAYHAFKRGQHYWQTRFSGGWRKAVEHFQQAVDRDDSFAIAHVALSAAYEFLGSYCLMKPKLAYSVARASVERALELNDELAAAHTQLALVELGGEWDWDKSEAAFRRAIQLDPAYAISHVCYAWLLVLLGRETAACEEARIGHDLAPASRFALSGRAHTLYLARQYDDAIELCNQCLELDPAYPIATLIRGQCYELKSMLPEAVADLERAAQLANRTPYFLGVLGHCYGVSGMRAKASALIDELNALSRQMYVPPQCYVFIHAGLGDRSQALRFQGSAYQDGASPFNYLAPYIRDLYTLDPHHKRRLEQMRLVLTSGST
jgi:TolB-like protein/tetratricopeptide (TPR) repeat protein/tRNA A-37 threonylcarbamoyl transferase component Bud32